MIELENGRRYLKQWELDKRVLIDGFLPGTWVEFSNLDDCKNSALITAAYVDAGQVYANIPNVLLQTPGYLHISVTPSASDASHSPEEKDIKVIQEEKPANYIYTETPTISFDSKADLFWGQENAGKAILVGEDGNLTAGDPKPRLKTISLPALGWTGSGKIYSQTVSVSGVTANSKVDLQPSPEQLRDLLVSEISLTAANDAGNVTVFAIGAAPTSDYTMQVLVTEVIVG